MMKRLQPDIATDSVWPSWSRTRIPCRSGWQRRLAATASRNPHCRLLDSDYRTWSHMRLWLVL
jgi:hypothetical protein